MRVSNEASSAAQPDAAVMKLHRPPISVYSRRRAESCCSSQHPQRGLIQTDPPLWVGSYYLSVTTADQRRPAHANPRTEIFECRRDGAPCTRIAIDPL